MQNGHKERYLSPGKLWVTTAPESGRRYPQAREKQQWEHSAIVFALAPQHLAQPNDGDYFRIRVPHGKEKMALSHQLINALP